MRTTSVVAVKPWSEARNTCTSGPAAVTSFSMKPSSWRK